MISFSNINKQYAKQLLFVDASFQLNPGEKVGLVGEETPDMESPRCANRDSTLG
jgi:ABC-type phosphonate transport system ATPase subunit